MSIEIFRQSLLRDAPPAEWSRALQALWHQAKRDWHRAHQLAQEQDDAEAAWVHAHLHRARGRRRQCRLLVPTGGQIAVVGATRSGTR